MTYFFKFEIETRQKQCFYKEEKRWGKNSSTFHLILIHSKYIDFMYKIQNNTLSVENILKCFYCEHKFDFMLLFSLFSIDLKIEHFPVLSIFESKNLLE